MDYTEYNDNELYSLICENNEDAKDILFLKYKYIIDIAIKKYAFTAMKYSFEYKDLYQEALVGFSKAIKSYNEEKNASLPTFINICVERRLQNIIRQARRIKNKFFLESLSLDYVYEQYEVPLRDVISDDNKNDPLESISFDESFDELLDTIKNSLSENEYEVYKLLITGESYSDIAKILGKNVKQIDNAIQRIKNKIKFIIKERQSA